MTETNCDHGETLARQFLDRGSVWQWRQIILLFLAYFSSANQALVIVFIGFQPKFACQDLNSDFANDSESFDGACQAINSTSNITTDCQSGFRYEIQRHESIVSEWDLVCNKAYLAEVSQLLYTVGMGVSAIVVPQFSDRVGRRWSFIVVRSLSFLCVSSIIFAPGIAAFMVLRFFIGALEMGAGLVRTVHISELSPVKLRPLITVLVGISWSVAMCVEALIAHLFRGQNWRYLQAVLSIPSLTVLLDLIFLRESLLWLYANNRPKQASALLKAAMRSGGKMKRSIKEKDEQADCATDALKQDVIHHSNAVEQSDKLVPEATIETFKKSRLKKESILDVLRSKTTRRLILIVSFVWFVNSLVYYGIFFMSSAMTGDRIFNFFLLGAMDLPASIGLFFILRYFGRQRALVASHGLCAVCLLLAGLLILAGQTHEIIMQGIMFVAKFGISITFLMLYFYTTEVVPTNVRTSGLGIASFCARCGAIISPFSSVLLRTLPWGPGIIFGSLCIIATFLLCLVPETGKRRLPQTLGEIEAWQEDKKQSSKS